MAISFQRMIRHLLLSKPRSPQLSCKSPRLPVISENSCCQQREPGCGTHWRKRLPQCFGQIDTKKLYWYRSPQEWEHCGRSIGATKQLYITVSALCISVCRVRSGTITSNKSDQWSEPSLFAEGSSLSILTLTLRKILPYPQDEYKTFPWKPTCIIPGH